MGYNPRGGNLHAQQGIVEVFQRQPQKSIDRAH